MRNRLLLAMCLSVTCVFFGCRFAYTQQKQANPMRVSLSVGQSVNVPDTDVKVTLEEIVEDSRCPTGTTCIWAGDATVSIAIASGKSTPSKVMLHTNGQFAQEAEQSGVLVRLMDVAPHPTADGPPRREAYRVSLSLAKK
jgi:hypothetical protein